MSQLDVDDLILVLAAAVDVGVVVVGVDGVRTVAAPEIICASLTLDAVCVAAADDEIIASATVENIIASVASERVVALATNDQVVIAATANGVVATVATELIVSVVSTDGVGVAAIHALAADRLHVTDLKHGLNAFEVARVGLVEIVVFPPETIDQQRKMAA